MMKVEKNSSVQMYNDTQSLQAINANPDRHGALVQAAEQFEALFLQSMLKNMRQANEAMQANDDEENPFNSRQQKFYRSMYDGQLSLEMSKQKGLGIAEMLVKQLSPHVAFKSRSDLVAIKQKENLISESTQP